MWNASCPVAASVAIVRPWKEPVSVTMVLLPLPYLSNAYLRAVLMAHSLASAPELEKNTRAIPVRVQSRSARSACGAE